MDSSLLAKVRHQVEFYFSDSNFPRDKFLREQTAKDEEGYVPINVLVTFPRLKQLTEDLNVIKESLKESVDLKLSSDGTMVKRIAPLPDQDTSKERTIYAKGFPRDGYSIEQVKQVYDKFGKIQCVRIRKTKDKKFKESCFIEFSTPEEAKAALAQPNKFEGKDLFNVMIGDYFQLKKEERKKKIDEKKKAKRKADDISNDDSSEKKGEKEEKKTKTNGCILQFVGVGPEMSRETLKAIFSTYGTVAFVDFTMNASEGYVRFGEASEAKKAAEELTNSKKEIGGKVPTLKVLGEEEERAYWEKAEEQKKGKGFKKKGKKRRF